MCGSNFAEVKTLHMLRLFLTFFSVPFKSLFRHFRCEILCEFSFFRESNQSRRFRLSEDEPSLQTLAHVEEKVVAQCFQRGKTLKRVIP